MDILRGSRPRCQVKYGNGFCPVAWLNWDHWYIVADDEVSHTVSVDMGKVFISLVVVFIVLGGALVYQATQDTSSLVLSPSEVLAKGTSRDLKRIRVGGRVVDPIQYQTDPQMILSFSVKNPAGGDTIVPVVYRGLKPDMFAAGRDVLIDGDFVGGTIQAAKLQTQCPSKYEPVVPGAVPPEGIKPSGSMGQ